MKLLQRIVLSSLLLPSVSLFSADLDGFKSDVLKMAKLYVLGHYSTMADAESKTEVKNYIAKALFPTNWEEKLQASKHAYEAVPRIFNFESGRTLISAGCALEILNLADEARREHRRDVESFMLKYPCKI